MEGIRIIKVERPITHNDKVVFLSVKIFEKVISEKYLKVLTTPDRDSYSKSYYYYILDFLRSIQLIKDNAIDFTVAVSLTINEKEILFNDEIIFVDKKDKFLVIKVHSNITCINCPLKAECNFALRKISNQLNVDLKGETLCDKWSSVFNHIIKSSVKKLNKTPILI